jgi:hypothetical protein
MVAVETSRREGDMSHGVHAVQHEVEHQIEHEKEGHGGGHGGGEKKTISQNQKIALVIAVIALFLAICETMGKSAQTEGISANVEAANLWAFFQTKTVRRTLVETAAQEMTLNAKGVADATLKGEMEKQAAFWKSEGARYRSEPSTQEGSIELSVRAKAAEKKRDLALARYHNYEFGSAAFQIGIVLASAAVITGAMSLVYLAMGLAAVGLGFMGLGLFAPHVTHDVMHWVEHLFTSSATHSGSGH